MSVIKNASSERLIAIGFTATLLVLLVLLAVGVIALLRGDGDNRAWRPHGKRRCRQCPC